MLTIQLQGEEEWDEDARKFVYPIDMTLSFEHSLVSLSKWEAIHEKPFLGQKEQTEEETLNYLLAMLKTPDVGPEVLNRLSSENLLEINAYINRPMTGTTIAEVAKTSGNRGETISAELVYYWMNSFSIPIECEHWHLNRLFTLIRVHNAKNSPPKKMSTADQRQRNRELNAQRKAKLGSNG